ncbi:hypothetical protein NDU88_001274 [Pleurodeles waltl]|uniref:Uncharacterized protein n=1 Tax=Pleurodeles waltl TaxID=8319 RepID=A0AAV7UTU9_PLEWA|nr:hypothetical protein NDU88_001274 [Pleurodeles waltl]
MERHKSAQSAQAPACRMQLENPLREGRLVQREKLPDSGSSERGGVVTGLGRRVQVIQMQLQAPLLPCQLRPASGGEVGAAQLMLREVNEPP